MEDNSSMDGGWAMVQAVMRAMGSDGEWQMKLRSLACRSPPALRSRGVGDPRYRPSFSIYLFLCECFISFLRQDIMGGFSHCLAGWLIGYYRAWFSDFHRVGM